MVFCLLTTAFIHVVPVMRYYIYHKISCLHINNDILIQMYTDVLDPYYCHFMVSTTTTSLIMYCYMRRHPFFPPIYFVFLLNPSPSQLFLFFPPISFLPFPFSTALLLTPLISQASIGESPFSIRQTVILPYFNNKKIEYLFVQPSLGLNKKKLPRLLVSVVVDYI